MKVFRKNFVFINTTLIRVDVYNNNLLKILPKFKYFSVKKFVYLPTRLKRRELYSYYINSAYVVNI